MHEGAAEPSLAVRSGMLAVPVSGHQEAKEVAEFSELFPCVPCDGIFC